MPIKRTAEELERPPLPRGSACHRCFTRKVRCSGQPETGHACSSCLRTARHRGHDPSQVRCSFEREGLCSEEGGPTLSGEILPGSTPTGPTRRQRPTVRSNHSSSTNSARSVLSTSSSARTDSYSTEASSVGPPTKGTNSPQANLDRFPSRLPSPPTNFQFPHHPTPQRHPSSLPSLILPTSIPLSTQAVASLPDASTEEPELPTPIASTAKSTPSLLHRRMNAPSRQLSLSHTSTPSSGSPYPGGSPYLGEYRQQTSAPLMLPPSWPNSNSNSNDRGPGGGGDPSYQHQQFAGYPHQPHQPLPQYYFDGPLPNTSFALDLAPFSALTPSTLAKMNLTPTSSYDFSSTSQQPSGITQPASFSPTGIAFTGASHALAPSSSQPGDPSFSSTLSGYAASSSRQPHAHSHTHPQESHPGLPNQQSFTYPSNFSLPLAPNPAYYSQYQQPPENQGPGGGPVNGGLPAPGYASSFHLASPGVTFSSSIPPDVREERDAPRYYYDR
ncbi:hypothetical protein JCM3766R1_003881 [Sporobolomyces carnicolor]